MFLMTPVLTRSHVKFMLALQDLFLFLFKLLFFDLPLRLSVLVDGLLFLANDAPFDLQLVFLDLTLLLLEVLFELGHARLVVLLQLALALLLL